jgi:hypothetical protein
VERLETIYSVASLNGAAGPSNYLVPPAAGSGSGRVPSVTRRQSRAERSAAKNIADAKRKGWNGRRKGSKKGRGKKKRERDVDAASSAAWTDVTSTSMASGFTGLFSRNGGAGGVESSRGRERERSWLGDWGWILGLGMGGVTEGRETRGIGSVLLCNLAQVREH